MTPFENNPHGTFPEITESIRRLHIQEAILHDQIEVHHYHLEGDAREAMENDGDE